MDARLKDQTRDEWRALGFFYDCDERRKVWRLVGSRDGLRRFSDLLRKYSADPRNAASSEHDHFGPYLYLEVMTWASAGIDGHAIRGTLSDLERLAALVEEKLGRALPGATIEIKDEFAADAEYGLVLQVEPDGFDPASVDADLAEQSV